MELLGRTGPLASILHGRADFRLTARTSGRLIASMLTHPSQACPRAPLLTPSFFKMPATNLTSAQIRTELSSFPCWGPLATSLKRQFRFLRGTGHRLNSCLPPCLSSAFPRDGNAAGTGTVCQVSPPLPSQGLGRCPGARRRSVSV